MAKKYYSDYVAHATRLYLRNPKSALKSRAEKSDWTAIHNVNSNYSDDTWEIIDSLYQYDDTMSVKVITVSRLYDISQGALWKLVDKFEREVAEERGLV